MLEAVLYAGIACSYGSASWEAFRIGHARLGWCYGTMAALTIGLALCHMLAFQIRA